MPRGRIRNPTLNAAQGDPAEAEVGDPGAAAVAGPAAQGAARRRHRAVVARHQIGKERVRKPRIRA